MSWASLPTSGGSAEDTSALEAIASPSVPETARTDAAVAVAEVRGLGCTVSDLEVTRVHEPAWSPSVPSVFAPIPVVSMPLVQVIPRSQIPARFPIEVCGSPVDCPAGSVEL